MQCKCSIGRFPANEEVVRDAQPRQIRQCSLTLESHMIRHRLDESFEMVWRQPHPIMSEPTPPQPPLPRGMAHESRPGTRLGHIKIDYTESPARLEHRHGVAEC